MASKIVAFNNSAREVVPWTTASPDAVQRAITVVQGLTPDGGTNLYDGIATGLHGLDAARATSLVLVTDGVTNTGASYAAIVQPIRSLPGLGLMALIFGDKDVPEIDIEEDAPAEAVSVTSSLEQKVVGPSAVIVAAGTGFTVTFVTDEVPVHPPVCVTTTL